jgi:magnesium transporter
MNPETHLNSDPIFDENNRGFCAILNKKGTQSSFSLKIDDFSSKIDHASVAWIDYIIDDFENEASKSAAKIGFSEELVKRLLQDVRGNYEDIDTQLGLVLPVVHVEGFDINIEPLIILLRENLLVTFHTRSRSRFYLMRRYADKYLKKLPKSTKTVDLLTMLLVRIIDENNSWNFKQLQEMDERSDDLTMDLKNNNVVEPHVGDQVSEMKHALLKYLSALWGTGDILSSLRYGDADLISDTPLILDRIVQLQNEIHQQLGLAEHLSDALASNLESLKSIYNNQLQDRNNQLQDVNNTLQTRNNLLQEKNNQLQDLNNTLSEKNNRLTATNNRITLLGAFLAILGAGFVVPNTIATVFSQTNIFTFSPKDMPWYVTLILTSTLVTLGLVYWWVRRIGLLPNISDEDKQ